MTKLGISVGISVTFFCFSVGAQTINLMVLDQVGAQAVLQAARESAQQRNAPSSIAVVDPAGDLLAFQRMDGVRPASADLAIEKARTAARLQRPTAEIEDNINRGRTAFVTAGIAALRGGVPIRVNGEVVGAVGVAGLSKENDTVTANTAAAALSPYRRQFSVGDGVIVRVGPVGAEDDVNRGDPDQSDADPPHTYHLRTTNA
jgi:glc operon protein GlcG